MIHLHVDVKGFVSLDVQVIAHSTDFELEFPKNVKIEFRDTFFGFINVCQDAFHTTGREQSACPMYHGIDIDRQG